MKIRVKSLANLNQIEHKSCYAQNMGDDGMMQRTYVMHRHIDADTTYAYMIWENRKLLAWVLVFEEDKNSWSTFKGMNAYFYTRPSHRQQGLGAALFDKVNADFPGVHVHPWDNTSKVFFSKMKEKVSA